MDEGIIIESFALGNSIKVTAIDTRTGQEATIVGDPKLPKRQLQQLAIKKLHYVMAKNN